MPAGKHPSESLPETSDLVPIEQLGALVGRYKLRELIGEGGMGTVWIAEQSEPVRRKVALKLIKPGMDTKEVISRFQVERQALALMDHPNIAKVLDGGVTGSGRPFFVMEYVKGIPITQYCDEARLTVRQRLALFVDVCQAVQHAHQKGIIHRDLKPSNILVCLYDGKPIPKIIDFGLAKAIHQPLTENTVYTAHGLMVGTPQYMSPEQAEFNNLDVDTRTDVYSLGVILYELLTGATPLDRKRVKEAAVQEVLRLIKEEDPPKPSTKITSSSALPQIAAKRNLDPAQLSRLVRGDLDWIAMRALEKDRSRRYETANGLARDIQRYLANEPVEACPPSLRYKLGKLAARNQGALATAALLILVVAGALAVVAGSIGWAARDRQTRRVSVERRIVSELNEFEAAIRDDGIFEAQAALEQADGLQAGILLTPQLAERIQSSTADLKFWQALRAIELERSFDNYDVEAQSKTVAAYQQAFATYGLSLDELGTSEAARRIRESRMKAHLLAALDDWSESIDLGRAVGDGTFISRTDLRKVASHADDDPWRKSLREALQARNASILKELAKGTEWQRQLPLTVVLLASALNQSGEGQVAEELLKSVELRHQDSYCVSRALGCMLLERESSDALRYLQFCRTQQPNNPSVRAALGWGLWLLDDTAAAERELREAIRLRPDYSLAHSRLGSALLYQGKTDSALQSFQLAMRFDPNASEPCHELAQYLFKQGRFADAEKIFKNATKTSPDGAPAYLSLGDALTYLNKTEEAQAAYDQALRLVPSLAEEINNRRARSQRPHESLDEIEFYLSQYTTAARRNPQDHGAAMRAAVLHLYLGNQSKYSSICLDMLGRFSELQEPRAIDRTALTCLLVSPPIGDIKRLDELAARGAQLAGAGTLSKLLHGRCKGLAAYRSGRWEEAIKWCGESRFAGQELVVSVNVPLHDMLIESMAHHQLGRTAEATRLYNATEQLCKRQFPGAPDSLGNAWFDWLVCEILRREAAQLLGIRSPAKSTTEPSPDAQKMALAVTCLDDNRWDEAAVHLEAVVEARPDDHLLAMQTAILNLHRGDRSGYDRLCQRLLQRYSNTDDPIIADRAAKACLLANPPAGEAAVLQRLAETAVSIPEHEFYYYFLLPRSLAAYRAGDFEAALAWCRDGRERVAHSVQMKFLLAQFLTIEAMCHHQLGHREMVTSALLEADALIANAFPDAPESPGRAWAEWMLFDLLRREVADLIKKTN